MSGNGRKIMLDVDQLTRTERRYAERAEARAETEAKLAAGEIAAANDPDHVRLRLRRKGIAPEVAERIVRGATALESFAISNDPANPALNLLERIIGTNDLIEARFLGEGTRATRCVCRIEIREPSGLVSGYGTGVLVSPQLLLTNNHVLASAESAASSVAEFNYEVGDDDRLLPSVKFDLDPTAFFVTDPELDYSLVAVLPESTEGRSLAEFGIVPLIVEPGKIIKGECVNIVQHPNGEPKQAALRENQVVDLLEDFLHYRTDTAPGSSGSPVFNDEWELVALHHSGVPARDGDGNILAIDGSLWSEEMGEHRVKWIANEGIRISRIVRDAQVRVVGTDERRLLQAALAGDVPSGKPSYGRVPEPSTLTGPDRPDLLAPTVRPSPVAPEYAFDADDTTAVWTIPLQVSVRLGNPVQMVARGPAAKPSADVVPESPRLVVAGADATLASALAELERGRQQPYFDAAADEAARTAYYLDLPVQRGSKRFFKALSDLLSRTHTPQLRYAPATQLYPWVDLQPDRKLRSIYTGQEYAPEEFINEDLRIERERGTRLQERLGAEAATASQAQEALDLLEALLPYNCEHVVPQSWFEKREPMRGDLHHLFACESRCNSFRGNTPYFEFPQFDEAVRQGCGMTEGNRFEPSHGKGAITRAVLYFLLRYPGEINRTAREYEPDRLAMLLAWHRQEPVGEYERHRNAAIFAKQGNRNPIIDFPEWADEIDFALGLGE